MMHVESHRINPGGVDILICTTPEFPRQTGWGQIKIGSDGWLLARLLRDYRNMGEPRRLGIFVGSVPAQCFKMATGTAANDTVNPGEVVNPSEGAKSGEGVNPSEGAKSGEGVNSGIVVVGTLDGYTRSEAGRVDIVRPFGYLTIPTFTIRVT